MQYAHCLAKQGKLTIRDSITNILNMPKPPSLLFAWLYAVPDVILQVSYTTPTEVVNTAVKHMSRYSSLEKLLQRQQPQKGGCCDIKTDKWMQDNQCLLKNYLLKILY